MSLQLLRVRQQAVLEGEWLADNVHSLDALRDVQVVLACQVVELFQQILFNLDRLQVFGALDRRDLLELVMVNEDDGDQVVELGIDLDAHLLDQGRILVDGLELLRGDELAVQQLLELVDSLDHLDGSVREDDAEVADLEPPFFVDDLIRLLRILKVPLHDTVALDIQLASRHDRACITVEVLHFSQLHSETREDAAHVAALSLPIGGARQVTGRLCGAVGFENGCREDGCKVVLDFGVEGCATRDHDSEPTSENVLDLAEDEWVVYPMVEQSVVVVVPHL